MVVTKTIDTTFLRQFRSLRSEHSALEHNCTAEGSLIVAEAKALPRVSARNATAFPSAMLRLRDLAERCAEAHELFSERVATLSVDLVGNPARMASDEAQFLFRELVGLRRVAKKSAARSMAVARDALRTVRAGPRGLLRGEGDDDEATTLPRGGSSAKGPRVVPSLPRMAAATLRAMNAARAAADEEASVAGRGDASARAAAAQATQRAKDRLRTLQRAQRRAARGADALRIAATRAATDTDGAPQDTLNVARAAEDLAHLQGARGAQRARVAATTAALTSAGAASSKHAADAARLAAAGRRSAAVRADGARLAADARVAQLRAKLARQARALDHYGYLLRLAEHEAAATQRNEERGTMDALRAEGDTGAQAIVWAAAEAERRAVNDDEASAASDEALALEAIGGGALLASLKGNSRRSTQRRRLLRSGETVNLV